MEKNLNTVISKLLGKPAVVSAKIAVVGDYFMCDQYPNKLIKVIGINNDVYNTCFGDISIAGCYYVSKDVIEYLKSEKLCIVKDQYILCR